VGALDEGLGTAAQIDEVAKRTFGVAAGPFTVMNLIKPRINLHAIRNLAPLGAFYAPAASMIEVGEADGSWEIEDGGALPEERASAIADMLRAGVFLPVLQALDEEIATPAAFDLGARNALKMGDPPCALMDRLGRAEVERIIRLALERHAITMPPSIERVGALLS
jgi:3-hydroxyacyl-CoA dehydrogenase